MANFAPKLVVDMYRAIKKNDIPTASSIFFEKILLFRHLDVAAVLQGFPIQIVYVKEAMNLLGMHGGSVRPPLTQLTREKKEELKRVLEVIEVQRPRPAVHETASKSRKVVRPLTQ